MTYPVGMSNIKHLWFQSHNSEFFSFSVWIGIRSAV